MGRLLSRELAEILAPQPTDYPFVASNSENMGRECELLILNLIFI